MAITIFAAVKSLAAPFGSFVSGWPKQWKLVRSHACMLVAGQDDGVTVDN